jgi:hypothetical protein
LFDHPVTSKLTICYPSTAIKRAGKRLERVLHRRSSYGCNDAASGRDEAPENDMKIYLLMLLIGTLLTAIHFTSAPKQPSKTLPQ